MPLHLRQRLFAHFMACGNDTHESVVKQYRRSLLGQLQGRVIEIGPGTGTNLPYFPRGIQWTGFEPNRFMHPFLHAAANQLGLTADVRTGSGERMDVPDASTDAVVCTLVLCSVRDQRAVLREALRVLKPGGQFVFIEHVAAPHGSRLRLVQNWAQPVWSFVGDGCRPNRETWLALEQAGFAQVRYERFNAPVPIAVPHIAGVARRFYGAHN